MRESVRCVILEKYVEVKGQPHATAVVLPGTEPPVSIG